MARNAEFPQSSTTKSPSLLQVFDIQREKTLYIPLTNLTLGGMKTKYIGYYIWFTSGILVGLAIKDWLEMLLTR